MNKEILLSYFPKITYKRYQSIVEKFSSLNAFWTAEERELKRALSWKNPLWDEFLAWKKEINEEQLEQELAKEQITCFTLSDPCYPLLLKTIYDPPLTLFVRGTLPKSQNLILAVVGSRNASPYGQEITRTLIRELVAEGLIIVSGLARGIDSHAHLATIKAGGKTIAVLGSGLARYHLTARWQNDLANEIIKSGGAVISEYPPKIPASNFTFPARNRIIAGLAQATLIIEAAEHSGALITAECSLEAGREVLAVPQNITSETSLGTNKLIQQGARIVTSVQDILETFNIEKRPDKSATISISSLESTEAVIVSLLSRTPTHIDDIIRNSKLSSAMTMSTLTRLEIKGTVRQAGGMKYTL